MRKIILTFALGIVLTAGVISAAAFAGNGNGDNERTNTGVRTESPCTRAHPCENPKCKESGYASDDCRDVTTTVRTETEPTKTVPGQTVTLPDTTVPGSTVRGPDVSVPGTTVTGPTVTTPGETVAGKTVTGPTTTVPGKTVVNKPRLPKPPAKTRETPNVFPFTL